VFWNKGNGVMVLENNQPDAYTNCISGAPQTTTTSQTYTSAKYGFSITLPSLASTTNSATNTDGYTVDPSYAYQNLGPGKDINGVKFTIPASVAKGTNLGSDSYISVEEMPKATSCTAVPFAMDGTKATTVTDNGVTYSKAVTGDAGAGNRYDETIYAIPGSNPCIAVRYYIHYAAFENYPAGAVTQFDEKALVASFDQIRRTLVINK
jgi:hypothetical protein